MAKIDLKFLDFTNNKSFVKIEVLPKKNKILCPNINNDLISISGYCDHFESDFYLLLDKSTAIKFHRELKKQISFIESNDK